MMSDYEILVKNFVHLLKTQPSLFSEEDRITLIELIENQADDIESLSNAFSFISSYSAKASSTLGCSSHQLEIAYNHHY